MAVGQFAQPVAGLLTDRLGRKNVLVPDSQISWLMALALTILDTGIQMTVLIARLEHILIP